MGLATTLAVAGAATSAYSAYSSAQAQKKAASQQQQSQTTQIPAWQQAQIQAGYNATNQAAGRTADQAVAGFNGNQTAAFDAVKSNQGMGYADYDQAISNAKGFTGALDYSNTDISKYYDPYQQQVINSTVNDLDTIRNRNRANINSQAEAAGAFGGDRTAVAQSLNDENIDRTAASTIAGLRSTGFNTAAGLAQNDSAMRNSFAVNNRGLQLNGNAQLQQMIDARRNASNQDASNLLTVGNQQQAQDQSTRDWEIQRANLINGSAGGNVGSTTNSTSTGGNQRYIDPVGAGLQGLNTGLQFGQQLGQAYDNWRSPVQEVQIQNASRI